MFQCFLVLLWTLFGLMGVDLILSLACCVFLQQRTVLTSLTQCLPNHKQYNKDCSRTQAESISSSLLSLYKLPIFCNRVCGTSGPVVLPGQTTVPAKHMCGRIDSPGCGRVCQAAVLSGSRARDKTQQQRSKCRQRCIRSIKQRARGCAVMKREQNRRVHTSF